MSGVTSASFEITWTVEESITESIYIFGSQRLPWPHFFSKIAHYQERKGEKLPNMAKLGSLDGLQPLERRF